MKNLDISIIICTYNRHDMLADFLENIKAQIFPEDRMEWEIVLVDNNSTDDTRGLVAKYRETHNLPIRYVFEQKQGKSHALNTGIYTAKGDLLVFTDDDVIVDRNWLSSVYEAFRQYPYRCFGGRVFPILEGPLPEWLDNNGKCAILGGPVVSHDLGNEQREYNTKMPLPIGSNMFVRKELFEEHGLFRTDLGPSNRDNFVYGEDTEFMLRIRDSGEKILYYPNAVVKHPTGKGRIEKSYFKKYYWGVGRAWARIEKIPEESWRYANIPRYVIRQSLRQIIKHLFSAPFNSKSQYFRNELEVIYYMGMMYEYYINGN